MKAGLGEDPVSRRLALVGREFDHGLAMDLSRMDAALAALGAPHHTLPPVLHVAGTNGKGSTCAFLRAMAEAAGLRAHVYTSPHLVRPNERIRVASQLIADDAFIAALDRIAATGLTVSYFEAVTLAAFLVFAETPADVTILEVGLGGRLDATNVIPHPAAAVITPVDLDHQQILGPDIAAIAGEKAGILKAGAPAVIARQQAEAEAVIAARAREVGAELHLRGQRWEAWRDGAGLIVETEAGRASLPAPNLAGPHQYENAALAAAAAMIALGDLVPAAALAAGAQRAVWPARLQRLTRGPLAARAAAKGCELWLDGAHNAHAGRALAAWMAGHAAPGGVRLIAGLLRTKDAAGFFRPMRGLVSPVIAVPVPESASSADPAELASLAAAEGLPARTAGSAEEALEMCLADAPRGGVVLIAGSLYLAGAVLAGEGGVD